LRKWLIEHPKLVRFLTKKTPFFAVKFARENFTISLPISFLVIVKFRKLHHVSALFSQALERQGSVSAKRGFWCRNGAETVQFSGARWQQGLAMAAEAQSKAGVSLGTDGAARRPLYLSNYSDSE